MALCSFKTNSYYIQEQQSRKLEGSVTDSQDSFMTIASSAAFIDEKITSMREKYYPLGLTVQPFNWNLVLLIWRSFMLLIIQFGLKGAHFFLL